MKASIFTLAMLPALLLSTESASAGICASSSEVAGQSCAANSRFVDAADSCLKRIEAQAAVQQAILTALVQTDTQRAGEAQSVNFSSNISSLAKTHASLLALKNAAYQARIEMMSYSMNFMYPANTSKVEAEQLGLTKYFSSFPCYADRQMELGETMQKTDAKIKEIEAAAKQVEDLKTTSHGSFQSLDTLAPAQVDISREPASAASPVIAPRGPNWNGSDISGTKKKEKK